MTPAQELAALHYSKDNYENTVTMLSKMLSDTISRLTDIVFTQETIEQLKADIRECMPHAMLVENETKIIQELLTEEETQRLIEYHQSDISKLAERYSKTAQAKREKLIQEHMEVRGQQLAARVMSSLVADVLKDIDDLRPTGTTVLDA